MFYATTLRFGIIGFTNKSVDRLIRHIKNVVFFAHSTEARVFLYPSFRDRDTPFRVIITLVCLFVCLFGWLVGFSSSSTTRLYRGRAPKQSV